MVDTNTINPKKAKVDGIILPSFSSMMTNHSTYNFNDVRVNHEIKGTMNYKSGTRNQVNLTRANLNTEIKFPSNTIHFNELGIDEDDITFDILVKGTNQRVNTGSYKLYIGRETSAGLITSKELLYQATINDADPIILSKSKLTNFSTIMNKFYNTDKINIFTGYTLYAEYTGVNGLYINSSGKSKLGLLAYSTRPKFILTATNNATDPDGIIMNNDNGYGDYIQNTSTPYLNLRTNTNKIQLSMKITDQNGRYIRGLKTDCVIQDFQEEHILWAKTYDANGEPEMLNGEYVLSEKYYGVGEDIDERGVFTPENGVTSDKLLSIGDIDGNIAWTWEVPPDWFEFTNADEQDNSINRVIKVTYIIGKNAQTFYGKRNPITNELEHPELRENSGAEFSFWVNLISPRVTEVKFPSKTIKFNEMNSNEDNITFDILDKTTGQNVNSGSYKLYIARETSTGLETSKELLHQAKITNSNTISLPKSSLTNFETIINKFYNTDKINIFTGYTLYVEYTGIEGVYLNSSGKSKLGVLAYSTEPQFTLYAVSNHPRMQGGILMTNTGETGDYIQSTSTSYVSMLGYALYIVLNVKDKHGRYIRNLKTDCIIQDFQQEHDLYTKTYDNNGNPIMKEGEYVLTKKHYSKGEDIDERGVFTPENGVTLDYGEDMWNMRGNAGWYFEIPDDWFIYMGKDEDNNEIPRVIKVTYIIGKNAQTFYGKTNPITNEVEYPDLREDSGAEFSFWVNLMVVE